MLEKQRLWTNVNHKEHKAARKASSPTLLQRRRG